jgi:hypothetical protein
VLTQPDYQIPRFDTWGNSGDCAITWLWESAL